MQNTTAARVKEKRLYTPPSSKCNVLCESLSEDSQNIPCATLRRRGVVVVIYLWSSYSQLENKNRII